MSLDRLALNIFIFLAFWVGFDYLSGTLSESTFKESVAAVAMAIMIYFDDKV